MSDRGESGSVMSLPIPGGDDAPRLARSRVLSRLEGRLNDEAASDVALVVSELVSNSVLHAHVGADQTMIVEVTVEHDRLGLSVTDPGTSLMPRLLAADPAEPGGFGLHLVQELSTRWGVRRERNHTQVWCEMALAGAG